ncbi:MULTISPECIES: hypothetical protein [Hyphomicrobiales]|uniref:hypothetical protein n=1 Tax=Hyphomicrobiales TaxID=356 RepID=UPI001A43196F|nr:MULTISPECIES: hypothetical protein [Hyphomicrobiales]MBK5571916.1 hypothetical protein [Ensifer sp. SSB1]HEX2842128.1 hypothetical protein [Hyphomicrobium sp.]
MAYHLHRLNLTGEPLREALKGKAYLATALSQGRATINHDFILELAATLSIAADELSRAPTDDETMEWAFYRISANNSKAVWSKAIQLAQNNNLSIRDLATLTGIDQAHVVRAASGKKARVFTLDHAQRLAASIPSADPHSLLPDDNERS